jgi:hypothetical protein
VFKSSKAWLVFVLALLLPMSPALADDFIPIENAAQLLAIREDPTKSYKLLSNIDIKNDNASTDSEAPQTADEITSFDLSSYLGVFNGNLDGNGLTISGLSKPLFSVVQGINSGNRAEISNLNLDTVEDGVSGRGILSQEIESNTTVDNVNVSGSVQGEVGATNLGGIAGSIVASDVENKSEIKNSSAAISITGSNNVGGLVGYVGTYASIINSTSSGSVSGVIVDDAVAGISIGGLAGINYGKITESSSTATTAGSYVVGGLVGWNEGEVSISLADGLVTGFSEVGGLVGVNTGTIEDSFSSGNVSSGDETYESGSFIGGLVGMNYGEIRKTYATGDVYGFDAVGGLVGSQQASGVTANSYAIGTVVGTWHAGGLIGTLNGSLENSYSGSQVFGANSSGLLYGVSYVGFVEIDSLATGCLNEECEPDLFRDSYPDLLVTVNQNYTEDDLPFTLDSCIDSSLPILLRNFSRYVRSCPSPEIATEEDKHSDSLEEFVPSDEEVSSPYYITFIEDSFKLNISDSEESLPTIGFTAFDFNPNQTGFYFLSKGTEELVLPQIVTLTSTNNSELILEKNKVLQLTINGTPDSQVELWSSTTPETRIFLGTIIFNSSGEATLPPIKFSISGIFDFLILSSDTTPALKTNSDGENSKIRIIVN